jgi:hypothetical protein
MFTGQTHKRKALEIWRGLIRSEHEFYEKYGYLDIIFDKSADIYILGRKFVADWEYLRWGRGNLCLKN